MVALRKKRSATQALAPFNPEQIMQGEPSLQIDKLSMTLQVASLFLEPLWKQAQPILFILKLKGMPIPDSLQDLISALLLQMNDEHMRSSVLSALEIMKAVVDDQVSVQAFEDILLSHIEVIKIVNSTKVEEVPA